MERIVLSPFDVATLWWTSRPGASSLTVVVRAAFTLVPGAEAVLAGPPPSAAADVFWENNPQGSLYAASDRAPVKRRADIVLVGRALSPGGVPAEMIFATLRVGDFVKALRVTGDRVWERTREGIRPSRPRPFSEMPLRYERGARRGDNLHGGALSEGGLVTGAPFLPCIEPANEINPLATPGFGPLPPHWRAARDRLSEEAFRWTQQIGEAAEPAPASFDFGFFNVAPRDQQVEWISPAATLVLENLHPAAPRFETRLPGIEPRAFWIEPGGRPADVALRLDTLWIDADRSQAVVSWRGLATTGERTALDRGQLYVASQAPGERLRFEDVLARARPESSDEMAPTPRAEALPKPVKRLGGGTLAVVPEDVKRLALPFAAPPTPAIAEPPRGDVEPIAPPPAAEDDEEPAPATLSPHELSKPATLPFAIMRLGHGTLPAATPRPDTAPRSALPFGGSSEPAAPAIAPPPLIHAVPEPTSAPPAIAEPSFAAVLRPEPEPIPPLPPPSFDRPPPIEVAPPEPPPPAAPEPLPEPPPPPAEPPLPELDLAACAGIAAELDLRRAPEEQILGEHGLSASAWSTLSARWNAALDEETDDGGTALLETYDAAYVARIEAARGPILAGEYALLLAGPRRRKAPPSLPGAELPRAGLMRVKRVGLRKITADAVFGAEVQRSIAGGGPA